MSQIRIYNGSKQRRRNSIDREFLGDYLGYKDNFLLQQLVTQSGSDQEQLIFSDHVNKVPWLDRSRMQWI